MCSCIELLVKQQKVINCLNIAAFPLFFLSFRTDQSPIISATQMIIELIRQNPHITRTDLSK